VLYMPLSCCTEVDNRVGYVDCVSVSIVTISLICDWCIVFNQYVVCLSMSIL
jgi:hypothetical protein